MKEKQIKVGQEITVAGRWNEIVEIAGGSIFVCDEDGQEKEISPRRNGELY